jgi:hypothetical protein
MLLATMERILAAVKACCKDPSEFSNGVDSLLRPGYTPAALRSFKYLPRVYWTSGRK